MANKPTRMTPGREGRTKAAMKADPRTSLLYEPVLKGVNAEEAEAAANAKMAAAISDRREEERSKEGRATGFTGAMAKKALAAQRRQRIVDRGRREEDLPVESRRGFVLPTDIGSGSLNTEVRRPSIPNTTSIPDRLKSEIANRSLSGDALEDVAHHIHRLTVLHGTPLGDVDPQAHPHTVVNGIPYHGVSRDETGAAEDPRQMGSLRADGTRVGERAKSVAEIMNDFAPKKPEEKPPVIRRVTQQEFNAATPRNIGRTSEGIIEPAVLSPANVAANEREKATKPTK